MTVRVNGEPREFAEETRLDGLVAAVLGRVDAPGVAVALNARVVPRSRWPETVLKDGDTLELVRAVQGG